MTVCALSLSMKIRLLGEKKESDILTGMCIVRGVYLLRVRGIGEQRYRWIVLE